MVKYEITIKVFGNNEETNVETLAHLTTDSPDVAASTLHAVAETISPIRKNVRGMESGPTITQRWPPGVRVGPTTTTNASGIIPS